MKTNTGSGAVKKAGERELNVVKDAAGKVTSASEGYFTFTFPELASLEEVYAFYTDKENAIVVTDDKGAKTTLTPEQTIVSLINAELERAAKANAYQKTVARFKPAEDPKAAFDKIVRTFMSLGLSEDMATSHARAALAENEAKEKEQANA